MAGDMIVLASDDKPLSPEQEQMRLRLAMLDLLGESLSRTRSDAINGREQSGIEDEWIEDEEFYQGVDDANRGEFKTTWRTKPMGQAAPQALTGTRSTVFPNITRPYCDAAAARIADMLLPTDDRAWGIKPTPRPEMERLAKGEPSQMMLRHAAQQFPGNPQGAQSMLQQKGKAAKQEMAEAKERADAAQTTIEDWHVECQWHAHVRQVIEDSSRIGTGVIKGPVPMKKPRYAWQEQQGMVKLDEIKPGSKWVDPWNVYPDPACGESIHNGSYIWERDFITKKQLRDLKGGPGYIDEQIDLVIREKPFRAIAEFKPTPDSNVDPMLGDDKYEIWYFHGTAEREDLEAMGCDCGNETDPHVPIVVEMVNNHIIKVTLNPLDTGEFPYDVMVWQRRSGFWAGIGVARQIRVAQRVVTGATRALMDNAGLASGPMIVFRQGAVVPADGRYAIAGRKIWYITTDAEEMADARYAIGVVKVDILVNDLLEIVNFGLRMAEDVTGLPMLMQGQMGNKAPDTLGGMQILNNNASAVLRRLARLFDDMVTEPHVRRYYHWHMQYGPDEEKGDYSIDARGSSALVERDLQNQAIMQMGAIVVNPVFGKDPKKWMDEFLKSQHLDVARFDYDDEQWQKIVEQLAQKPGDPRVEVAKMTLEHKERLQAAEQQFNESLTKMEQAFEARENHMERELKLLIAGMDEQGQQAVSVRQLKGLLATTSMKLVSQERMSDKNNRVSLTKEALKPAAEPKGRAAPGKSFTD